VSFLDDLLARLREVPADQHGEIIRAALAEAGSALDPAALTAEILARFDAATEGGTPADDATVDTLETLAAVADGVTEHQAAVDLRAQRAADAADRIRSLTPTDPEPAADAAPAEPEPGAGGIVTDAPATGDGDGAPATVVPEPVAASARPAATVRVPLGLSNAQPPAPTAPQPGRSTYSLIAAGDVPGYSTGQPLPDLTEFGRAWEARMHPFVASRTRSRQRVAVARIRRETAPEFTIRDAHDPRAGEEVIARATDESRLPGGSLVAAGGWCAPSETLYDLCDLRITNEGMVDLPPVTATRGGIRYPADFDWSTVWASAGFHQTEAQAIAGDAKPCIDVPCDDDFVECRLDADGVCIRTPILTERGWPERVARFTEGVLAIHAHKLNAWKIAKMVSLSTAVTMPAPAAPDPNAAVVDPHGPGAVESVLSFLELQVQYQRYRERLSQGESLELVAPFWLRGILKSDLRKKLGIDNRWNVTDEMLDTYLRNAGVNPQWVYDWQDAYASGVNTDFGGTAVPTVWPSQVKVLLYRAGSFFQLQADVISLDGVYDYASLTQNMYTSLFTEEGIQVCMRCGSSYVLTIPLCANGLSGASQSVACAAAG
jgi:hypothetical protein